MREDFGDKGSWRRQGQKMREGRDGKVEKYCRLLSDFHLFLIWVGLSQKEDRVGVWQGGKGRKRAKGAMRMLATSKTILDWFWFIYLSNDGSRGWGVGWIRKWGEKKGWEVELHMKNVPRIWVLWPDATFWLHFLHRHIFKSLHIKLKTCSIC